MKKLFLFTFLLSFGAVSAQKHANGKIFDKHPALDIVDEFTKA
jgi:hypothetical protein